MRIAQTWFFRKIAAIGLSLLAAIVPIAPAAAQDRAAARMQEFRSYDPATRTLRATGLGEPPPGKRGAQARLLARQAAEVRAVHNLAGVRGGARVRGYRVAATETLPNGWVRVTVETANRRP